MEVDPLETITVIERTVVHEEEQMTEEIVEKPTDPSEVTCTETIAGENMMKTREAEEALREHMIIEMIRETTECRHTSDTVIHWKAEQRRDRGLRP